MEQSFDPENIQDDELPEEFMDLENFERTSEVVAFLYPAQVPSYCIKVTAIIDNLSGEICYDENGIEAINRRLI